MLGLMLSTVGSEFIEALGSADMAIHLQDKKRLETLQNQLYGKSETFKKSLNTPKVSYTETETTPTIQVNTNFSKDSREDAHYLKKDLYKTLILSVAAILIQLVLYWSLNNNLVHL